MSSSYSPWWRRFLQKYFKFLFIVCPEGNYHWRWNKICRCQDYCEDDDAHPVYLYIGSGNWKALKSKRIKLIKGEK